MLKENNKNRNSIKVLKVLGAILFAIEYLALIVFVGYWIVGLFVVTPNNYYSYIKNTSKTINVDNYSIYSNDGTVFMYVSYKDYDESNDEYSATYTLRDRDTNYYYLANDNEEIMIEARSWMDDLITTYETTDSDYYDYLDNYISYHSNIIDFALFNYYYLYDAGDTLGVKARYTYYDVYVAKEHDTSGITFDYYKTYSYRGDRPVESIIDPSEGETVKISSGDIIDGIPEKRMSEATGWLIILFAPFIFLFIVIVGFFVLLIILVPPILYSYMTCRSFKLVESNDRLKIFGKILFITGCGIFSFLGAKKDEENVKEINDELNRRAEKKRLEREEAIQEKQKEVERKAANGTLEFKGSPKPGAICAGIGGAIVGICIDLIIIGHFINEDIYDKTVKATVVKSGASPLTLAAILLFIGIALMVTYVKKRKKYEETIAKAKANNESQDEIEDEENSKNKKTYYCQFCGHKIKEGDLFCAECGAKVEIPEINDVNEEELDNDSNLENESELADSSTLENESELADSSSLENESELADSSTLDSDIKTSDDFKLDDNNDDSLD